MATTVMMRMPVGIDQLWILLSLPMIISSTTIRIVISSSNDTWSNYNPNSTSVIGCPDPLPPKSAYVTRKGDRAVVRCNHTRETWYLTCSGTRWVGTVGNCTSAPVKSPYYTNRCPPGSGFPDSCPRPEDDRYMTKCCRDYDTPMCCEEGRAQYICAYDKYNPKNRIRQSSYRWDPPENWNAIYCPRKGDPYNFRECYFSGSNMECMKDNSDAWKFSALVSGLLVLPAVLVTIGIVVHYKRGKYFRGQQARNQGYQGMTENT